MRAVNRATWTSGEPVSPEGPLVFVHNISLLLLT